MLVFPKISRLFSWNRSYEHMGVAEISCFSGCECKGVPSVDGHDASSRVSVTKLLEFPATQSRDCILRVVVLPQTSSGQNKFKVIQLATTFRG